MNVVLCLLGLLARAPAGLEAAGDGYQAVVGPTGQLTSLRLGACELLDVTAPGGGGVLANPLPLLLDQFSYVPVTRVTASCADATVNYRFSRQRIEINVINASSRPADYRLSVRDGWKLEEKRVSVAWGAALEVSSRALPRQEGHVWRWTCAPFDLLTISFAVSVPAGQRPARDGLWVEPRLLSPGSFALPARPPYTDPTGQRLNLPLVLCNDTDVDQAAKVGLKLAGTAVVQQVTLPARRAAALDLRMAAPPPGVHALEVTLETATDRTVSTFTLAFAPEQWPPTTFAPMVPATAPVTAGVSTELLPGWSSTPLAGVGAAAVAVGTAWWPRDRVADGVIGLGLAPGSARLLAASDLAGADLRQPLVAGALALLKQHKLRSVGVYVNGVSLDLRHPPAELRAVAAFGPPWPAVAAGIPLLAAGCPAPGEPAERPVLAADGEFRCYTGAPDVARAQFECEALAWLARHVAPPVRPAGMVAPTPK